MRLQHIGKLILAIAVLTVFYFVNTKDHGTIICWADNSPIYSDGWMLQHNDTTGEKVWISPTDPKAGVCNADR